LRFEQSSCPDSFGIRSPLRFILPREKVPWEERRIGNQRRHHG
jgi:hypothetical protein